MPTTYYYFKPQPRVVSYVVLGFQKLIIKKKLLFKNNGLYFLDQDLMGSKYCILMWLSQRRVNVVHKLHKKIEEIKHGKYSVMMSLTLLLPIFIFSL